MVELIQKVLVPSKKKMETIDWKSEKENKSEKRVCS